MVADNGPLYAYVYIPFKNQSAVSSVNSHLQHQGALFSPLDDKRVQSKLPATQAQKLRYANNWYIWIENTLMFLKLLK